MDQLKQVMMEQFDKLNKKIDLNNEKFLKLEEEIKELKIENKKIQDELIQKDNQINYLENKIKRNNIVVHGIEEGDDEDAGQLETR